jgi:hypothetical protein
MPRSVKRGPFVEHYLPKKIEAAKVALLNAKLEIEKTEFDAKININNSTNSTRTMLLNLLDDEDTSTAVQSWRSTSGSSSDEFYLTQNPPYQAKHAPFETVEELALVEGITHDILYGNGTAPPLGQRSNILAGGMNGGASRS